MASQYWVDATNRIGVVQLKGSVELKEIIDGGQGLLDDPQWVPGFCEFWDLSDVTQLVLAPSDLKAIVDLEMASLAQTGMGAVAILITRPLDYTIAYLYQLSVRRTGRSVQIFRKGSDACAWLGVPPDVLVPPA